MITIAMTYIHACLKLESRNRASSNTSQTTAITRMGISHAPRLNLSLTGRCLRLMRYRTTVEAYITAGSSVGGPNSVKKAVSQGGKNVRIRFSRKKKNTGGLNRVWEPREDLFPCCPPGDRSVPRH